MTNRHNESTSCVVQESTVVSNFQLSKVVGEDEPCFPVDQFDRQEKDIQMECQN